MFGGVKGLVKWAGWLAADRVTEGKNQGSRGLCRARGTWCQKGAKAEMYGFVHSWPSASFKSS